MKLPNKKQRTKSDAIKLFLFLCVVGLSLLATLISKRGWFRTHLPSDVVGVRQEVGYGQYFSESSLFDLLLFWVFAGTPMAAACITWIYMRYFKVQI